jgi:hypothetical protein
MSLFDLSREEQLECEAWLSDIKSFNKETIHQKCQTYSFNFTEGKPSNSEKIIWEKIKTKKQVSSNLFSLKDQQTDLLEDQPDGEPTLNHESLIQDFNLRLSNDSSVNDSLF